MTSLAVILSIGLIEPSPKVYWAKFTSAVQYASTTPERAMKEAVPCDWAKAVLSELPKLVHSEKPGNGKVGTVRLAIETKKGWIYVDHFGRASGALAGSFDVLAWEKLLRTQGKESLCSHLLTVRLQNRLQQPLKLVDSCGFVRGQAPAGETTDVVTWYGEHHLQLGSRSVLSFPYTADRVSLYPAAADKWIVTIAVKPRKRLVEMQIRSQD